VEVKVRLRDKVALVTGAGRGIGKAIALRLAEDGATLIVHYGSSRDGAEAVVSEIQRAGGRAVVLQADLTKRADITSLFERIDRNCGRIDIVVNSAGVSGGTALRALDVLAVESMVQLNLLAPLYIVSEAQGRMGAGGRIVNLSSSLAEFPMAGASTYAATKAGVKMFTECWAKELGAKGITVNTVVPGATSPGMMDSAPEHHREFFTKASPFGRIGRAEEIAAVVSFLCSPEASWVSGAHILANGAANT
jgi:3-oxoacyl-[acyl-carrier protein] reductase